MSTSVSSKFRTYASKLTVVLSAIVFTVLAWVNPLVNMSSANAETIADLPFIVAVQGVTDQIEGKIEKGIGSAKRATGDLTDNYSQEAEGALQQAKGDVKQSLGTAKNKLDEAGNKAEDTSESIIDSVKDFFD